MERHKGSWYARKEIQKVTLDWVKSNCRLSDREYELLQIIYERKLVRRDHLEVICKSYRKLSGNRTLLLNKSIRKMYRTMVLDKIHEKREMGRGNKPCIVAVDKGGSLLLSVTHRKRITHKKIVNKGGVAYIERNLPINYRHINGINQLEVHTILFCEESDSELVLWKNEYGREFFYNQEKILFIPDVLAQVNFEKKNLIMFIEYDTGSENIRNKNSFPIIYNKLINYKKYKLSNMWAKEFKYYPLILFVTEDDKRIDYFNKKCEELNLQGFAVYYENYKKVLERLSKL